MWACVSDMCVCLNRSARRKDHDRLTRKASACVFRFLRFVALEPSDGHRHSANVTLRLAHSGVRAARPSLAHSRLLYGSSVIMFPWQKATPMEETMQALEQLEVQRQASNDRRSSSGSADEAAVYRYTTKLPHEVERRLSEAKACERATLQGAVVGMPVVPTVPPGQAESQPIETPCGLPPAPSSSAPPAPPPPSPASTASAALVAALEADEAGDPIAALPKYIEAAEAYMTAVAAATSEQSAKWSRQARSCVERAEELKPLAERAEAERALQRREAELAEREKQLSLSSGVAATASGAAALLPSHWIACEASEYSADGFVLLPLDGRQPADAPLWATLKTFLETENASALGDRSWPRAHSGRSGLWPSHSAGLLNSSTAPC